MLEDALGDLPAGCQVPWALEAQHRGSLDQPDTGFPMAADVADQSDIFATIGVGDDRIGRLQPAQGLDFQPFSLCEIVYRRELGLPLRRDQAVEIDVIFLRGFPASKRQWVSGLVAPGCAQAVLP